MRTHVGPGPSLLSIAQSWVLPLVANRIEGDTRSLSFTSSRTIPDPRTVFYPGTDEGCIVFPTRATMYALAHSGKSLA